MVARKRLALTALAATMLAASPGVAAEKPWRLVWSDGFDGDRLDLSKWSYAVDCGGGGNNERQCYTDAPDIVTVRDGLLRLTTVKRPTTALANPWGPPDGPVKTGEFASGKILTKGKAAWRYGRIEARARVPGGQGVWPAIWMMPETSAYGGWPRSGEIDILETINLGAPCASCEGGRENRIFGTIHFGKGAGPEHRQWGGQTAPVPTSDGFHVYAVEWSPGRIDWFVDGVGYFTATAEDWKPVDGAARPDPFDQPFHLILNLAFGGAWPEGANAKGVDEVALPATMEVDWVRVSQR